jgi:signal-transduction protein with cAMP-binding, CBS, and nucleotidyltransferase domain
MSLKDQKAFLSKIHPFEVLSHEQMEICIKNMDIAYYPKDSILISAEKIPNHFFIIIKGSVYEYSIDNEVVIDYQEEDSFDSNSLIYAKATNTFKVYEDLICYELEKNIFLKLIEQNQQFRDYFLKDLVNKIQTLKDKKYTYDDKTNFYIMPKGLSGRKLKIEKDSDKDNFSITIVNNFDNSYVAEFYNLKDKTNDEIFDFIKEYE